MAQTPSTMLALGTTMPAFTLPDTVTDRSVRTDDVRGPKGTLVMFLCNHCPYVKHAIAEIGRVGKDAREQGLGVVAISSNDIGAYPEDSLEKMKTLALEKGWQFPYVCDESQDVAKAFHAACGRDLRTAMHVLLEGGTVPEEQTPSVGCNIEWKAGNEPDWFG